MIKKLKRKFILLTMTSLLVLLAVIVAGMNLMNYSATVAEADRLLSLLAKGEGGFPEGGALPEEDRPRGRFGGGPLSPEAALEARFFSVQFDSNGEVLHTDTSKIASVTEEEARALARQVLENEGETGFCGDFRYQLSLRPEGPRVTFLDCGRKLESCRRFLGFSLLMSAAGYVFVGLIATVLSGKIIRPIAESYAKQKQFITDAGHEIKTPLTIINANVDILEAELGAEHECLRDIQAQANRLTSLTNDLVYLSRMEEQEVSLPLIEFPAGDLIAEAVAAFRAPAQAQGKTLRTDIQTSLSFKGEPKSIEKLVSILMNNALKYSPEGGDILVRFQQNGRHLLLTVVNTSCYELEPEKLDRVFDRFYRADPSRNSEIGGHGIGLSMAKAIALAHRGSIRAWTDDGKTFGVAVSFPSS